MDMSRYPSRSTARLGWRGIVNKIKESDKEFNKYWSIASDMEKSKGLEKRKNQVARYKSVIIEGMLKEHRSYAKDVQRAEELMRLAQKEEINSWDTSKLAGEMDLASKRIDRALKTEDPVTRINDMVKEADQSKDKYKIRALAEELTGEGKQMAEFRDRADINWLSKVQDKKLRAIRTSDRMKSAQEVANQAYDNYEAKKGDLCSISELIGEGDPLHPLATNDLSRVFKEFNNRA